LDRDRQLAGAYTGRVDLSARRIAVVVSFALASLGCCGLVVVRNLETGNPNFRYLIWNLFLAWIPFVLALLFYDGHRRGMGTPALVTLGALWLVFFPNGPYIVTDFVHLSRDPLSPLWFDGLTIGAFAAMGLLLGLGSLYLIQSAVRRELGWAVVSAALLLGSVGIYVGRFVRLNSWDFFTNPHHLAYLVRLRLADPLGNPKLIAVVATSTLMLGAAYLLVYAVASPSLRLELDRRR
jgi:uncharacterized membrane protein